MLPRSTSLTYIFLLGLAFVSPLLAQSSKPSILLNLPYKNSPNLSPAESQYCRLDLYLPAGKTGFPTLLWLHGGALQEGSKDQASSAAIAKHFAASGIAVACANYRLSPQSTFPAYLDDTAAAFAWTRQHIAEHGGNPQRLFLGGHSAGGYLALMVGLDPRFLAAYQLEPSAIAGLIPVSGQTLTHYTIREERGLPKARLFADEAAPLFHVHAQAPPLLILYAEHDLPLRAQENELLAAAFRQANHPHLTLRLIAGHDHGSIGDDLAKDGDVGFSEILRFIAP